MAYRLFFQSVFLSIALWCGVATHALTAAEVADDVALAREAFERVHPGYDRYTTSASLEQAWQAIVDDARGADGMETAQFYLRVQQVLALIRCGHTKAELPPEMSRARRTDPYYLPLRYELVEGRAIVTAVGQDTGVAINDEILSIDGRSMPSLIARYTPLMSVDGFTDHTRHNELAWSLEFAGGAIEHFMALEGVAPNATLELVDAAGSVRTVSVARVGLDAQRTLGSAGEANFVDAVTVDYPNATTAVLRVDTFVNYRQPVDPDDVYQPLFRDFRERGIEHLIVDLRRNGGGSNDARDALLSYLITERTIVARDTLVKTLDLDGLREHLSTWDSRALNPKRWWFSRTADGQYRLRTWLFGASGKIKPAREAFDGRLTLLSASGNASGVTMMMAALQATGRARIVGEPTGGNVAGSTAGILFTLSLPASGIRLRLPLQRTVTGYDEQDSGRGITPALAVSPTVDDVRRGRDRALELALATP